MHHFSPAVHRSTSNLIVIYEKKAPEHNIALLFLCNLISGHQNFLCIFSWFFFLHKIEFAAERSLIGEIWDIHDLFAHRPSFFSVSVFLSRAFMLCFLEYWIFISGLCSHTVCMHACFWFKVFFLWVRLQTEPHARKLWHFSVSESVFSCCYM